jgi:hypothetical protein
MRWRPAIEHVFSMLAWEGDCLVFTGRIKDGYGLTSETRDGVRRFPRAHRVVYESTVGELPVGMYVLHSCDNRACCNPEHLRLGTHEENMRDRAERARTFNGRSAFTHCPSNHPYDEANTYVSPQGTRSCRTCHRERARAAREGRAS